MLWQFFQQLLRYLILDQSGGMIRRTAGETKVLYLAGWWVKDTPEGTIQCLQPAEDQKHQKHDGHFVPGMVSVFFFYISSFTAMKLLGFVLLSFYFLFGIFIDCPESNGLGRVKCCFCADFHWNLSVVCISCLPRFTLTTAYYGLSLNTSQLHANPYISCFISAAVEVPAYITCWLVLRYVPRRLSVICIL